MLCTDGYHRIFYRLEGESAEDGSVMTLPKFSIKTDIRLMSRILTIRHAIWCVNAALRCVMPVHAPYP
ncbi:hypothetical protein ACVXHB_13310 [Escherichia coli]